MRAWVKAPTVTASWHESNHSTLVFLVNVAGWGGVDAISNAHEPWRWCCCLPRVYAKNQDSPPDIDTRHLLYLIYRSSAQTNGDGDLPATQPQNQNPPQKTARPVKVKVNRDAGAPPDLASPGNNFRSRFRFQACNMRLFCARTRIDPNAIPSQPHCRGI